jgi:hypothetical protein
MGQMCEIHLFCFGCEKRVRCLPVNDDAPMVCPNCGEVEKAGHGLSFTVTPTEAAMAEQRMGALADYPLPTSPSPIRNEADRG